MTIKSGLDYIRSRSIVDCDTMDEQGTTVAKTFGPFHDCTSNQAIAYNELIKPEHDELLHSSLTQAKALIQEYPGLTIEELAIEIAMISLSLRIAPDITGHIHIQTNPYYSYSTEKTIVNALRTFKDPSPLLHFSALAQKYYASIGSQTQVLPASLTSTNEIFALAGVQHITIAPGLLEELAKPLEGKVPVESLFDSPAVVEGAVPGKEVSYVNDESGYRIAFTRDAGGLSEEKLTQAVNIFCDMQDKLVQVFKGLN
ncbi:AP-1 complex subunit mu-1 [Aspergillus niger]|uniref:AP-1 complex subunit mu-1 n=1 Tax=Aspergillus niger TaxID=5061 RepID=A0A505I4G1_ASPNG|nr:AP-1 complex subunit mu-1 [Aspergillus niger]